MKDRLVAFEGQILAACAAGIGLSVAGQSAGVVPRDDLARLEHWGRF